MVSHAEKLTRNGALVIAFSLIIPTLGRTSELKRLLNSLQGQKLNSFSLHQVEVIVLDQNSDRRLDSIVGDYESSLTLKHVRIPSRGLSRAKNEGLRHASGRNIAFLDDDCWLPEDYLENGWRLMGGESFKNVLIGRAIDPELRKPLLRYPVGRRKIDRGNLSAAFLGVQIAQIYPSDLVRDLWFDERLGVGSGTPWGSGEDTDFLIRSIARGGIAIFDPELTIFHPWVGYGAMSTQKIRSYAAGFGAVCAKHRLASHLIHKVGRQGVLAAFAAFRLNPSGARFSALTALYRLKGYLAFRLSQKASDSASETGRPPDSSARPR